MSTETFTYCCVLYAENARSNLSIHWAHMPLCWFCHARLLLIRHVNQYIVVSKTPPIVIERMLLYLCEFEQQ